MIQPLAPPPYDAVMPDAQMGLIWAWAVLAAVSFIFCVISSIRSRSLLPLSVFLGAGLAMFGESLVIQSMHTWYPAVNQVNAYVAFGQSVPLFAALAYWFYFAPAILMLMKQYERGMTQTAFWITCALTIAGVLAYEIAGLSFDLWSYYGIKPFLVGGLPITWLFINASTVIPASVILYRLRAYLQGPRLLLVVAFMSAQVPAFEFLTGYPVYIAINRDSSMLVAQLAAALSIIFVISLFWVCSKAVCLPATRR